MVEQLTEQGLSQGSAQALAHAAPHKNTAGQIIHRELTYRGIDWGLNSALSVAFALAVRRTRRGYDIWNDYVGGFFKKVLSPVIKNEETLKQSVEGSKDFISILAGGTVIIPFIMGLENKHVKKSMVKTFDRWIYGQDKVENDPRFKEAYDSIDHEAKKDFGTGMLARLFALAPMYTIMSFKATGGKFFSDEYYPRIAKVTQRMAEGIGLKPNPATKAGKWLTDVKDEIHSEMVFGEKKTRSNWEFIHYMIGYDFGMTIFYSILHEIFYKLFSQNKQNRHERHQAPPHGAPVANPAPSPQPVPEPAPVVAQPTPAQPPTITPDPEPPHAPVEQKPGNEVNAVAHQASLAEKPQLAAT